MDFTDLTQTQEIGPALSEKRTEKDAPEQNQKKEGHTFSFLLTVQWAVCLFIAIVFLGVRFFLPEQADTALHETVGCVQKDFSFAPTIRSAVNEVLASLSFTGMGGEAATAGIPANATTAPVVYTGQCTFPIAAYTRVSSPFGVRKNPFGGGPDFHKGVDIAAPEGTRILAAADGEVVTSTSDEAFGNYIKIDHGNGFYTLYGHCSSLVAQKGMRVRAGDVIAYVGSTGNSTGNHLHFAMVKNGVYFDPAYVYDAFAVHAVSILPAMGTSR